MAPQPPFDGWQGFKDLQPPLPEWEPNPDPTSIDVPGLDTEASINDQIDQMNQLITIKLQKIDANFQKVQEILSNKILPAFRRYAESTGPIREAAQFWLSFYEAAARISMPSTTDFTASSYEQTETEQDTRTADYDQSSGVQSDQDQDDGEQSHANMTFDPNQTPSEPNFSHHAAVSSTPLHPPSHNPSMDYNESSDFSSVDSLTASLETPSQRLVRQIESLNMDLRPPEPTPGARVEPTPSIIFKQISSGRTPKGKGKAALSNLREGVLRQNMSRGHGATPHKQKNPFVQGGSTKKWDGIVDLTKSPGVPSFSPRRRREERDHTADSDDIWPPGMSPLQTVRMDIPGVPNVQPSPRRAKPASVKIKEALLANVASARDAASYAGYGGSYASTSGTEMTTPSLTGIRYTDAGSRSSLSSLPHFESQTREPSIARPLASQRLLDNTLPVSQEDDFNSDEDDETQQGNAFNFLAQRVQESTGSSDSDSASDDGTLNPAFAGVPTVDDGDDSFDDSFDRVSGTGTGTNLFAPRGSQANAFAIKGQGLLDDTLGIGQVLKARAGSSNPTSTPTPYNTQK